MVTVEKIERLLRPLLDGAELELLDLKVMSSRGKAAFVAVIDHRHRPVRVEELTSISRALEDHLDMDEEIPRNYSLDVSSPGVTRPLTFEWEFAKNIGRPFTVYLEPDPGKTDGEPETPRPEAGDTPPPPPTTAKQRRKAKREELHQLESFEAELTGVREGTLTFDNGRSIPLERVRQARVKLPW